MGRGEEATGFLFREVSATEVSLVLIRHEMYCVAKVYSVISETVQYLLIRMVCIRQNDRGAVMVGASHAN